MSASSAGTLGVFHPRRLVFDPREDRRLYLFLAAVYVLADRILRMCLKWARIGGRRTSSAQAPQKQAIAGGGLRTV